MALVRRYLNTGAAITLGDGSTRIRYVELRSGTDMPSPPLYVQWLPSGKVTLVTALPHLEQEVAGSLRIYTIDDAPHVGRDMPINWNVSGPVGRDMPMQWNVSGPVGRDMPMLWHVLGSGGGPSDDFPNVSLLPGTPTLLVNEGFQDIDLPAGPNSNTWTFAGWSDGNPAIVSDATAPYSPDFVRWSYALNYPGGTSPGRAVNGENNFAGSSHYYIGAYVRWSKPWSNHPSGVDKLFYWSEKSNTGSISSFMVNRRGTLIDVVLQYGQSYSTMCKADGSTGLDNQRNIPNSACGESYATQTSVDDGQWHLVEVVVNRSTGGLPNGRIRVYVDEVLQFDVSNCRFAPTGNASFFGINLDPVWGGTGSNKSTADTFDMAALQVWGSAG